MKKHLFFSAFLGLSAMTFATTSNTHAMDEKTNEKQRSQKLITFEEYKTTLSELPVLGLSMGILCNKKEEVVNSLMDRFNFRKFENFTLAQYSTLHPLLTLTYVLAGGKIPNGGMSQNQLIKAVEYSYTQGGTVKDFKMPPILEKEKGHLNDTATAFDLFEGEEEMTFQPAFDSNILSE